MLCSAMSCAGELSNNLAPSSFVLDYWLPGHLHPLRRQKVRSSAILRLVQIPYHDRFLLVTCEEKRISLLSCLFLSLAVPGNPDSFRQVHSVSTGLVLPLHVPNLLSTTFCMCKPCSMKNTVLSCKLELEKTARPSYTKMLGLVISLVERF